MHVHLPKPLHGWRALMGEVGIIVIGVLLALAAEQAVQALHSRSEARDFREAVDREAALNLGNFAFDQLQEKCTRRRLDELQAVLEQSRSGAPVRLTAAIGMPLEVDQNFSVWENKDAQVFAQLPLDVRLRYAQLYDVFRTTQGIMTAQNEAWKKLTPYEEVGPLALEDRRQLHALISDARGLNQAMVGNWPFTLALASRLGIKPSIMPELRSLVHLIPRFDLCKSILKA